MRKNRARNTTQGETAQKRPACAKKPPRHQGKDRPLLKDRLRFEEMLFDVSARFVNIAPEAVEEEIERSLKQIREFFGVDRCVLLKTLSDGKSWQIALAACVEGIPPIPEKTALPISMFPWVAGRLLDRREVVYFKTTDDLPPEAEIDRQSYNAWGIKSSMTIPILISEHIGYALAINAVTRECAWTEDYASRLHMLGEVFVNALERGRIDRALRESEERLSLAADSSGAVLWNLRIDTGHIWTTEKGKEFFGFAREAEMDMESFLNIVHPEDRERIRLTVDEAMRSGKESGAEYRIVRPDGSVRWALSRGRPYPASGGDHACLMGISIDITERKLAEAERLESMERYSAIVDAFDGLIYICSPDYRIEFMNRRMIERTGRNAVGEFCYKVLHDSESVCEWCVNDRVFRGETVRWEVQSPKDHRWYYIVNTPIRHADGTISKQSMIMDITERKLSEEALKSSQQDLRRLTGKLISTQEEELRRLSRELHDDLTQKLAVLAIETGKLELELDKASPSLRTFSQKIARIKEQLISVSEDIHHISRQIHPSILDDLGLVRAIESECTGFSRRENVKVSFIRDEGIPSVDGNIALCLYRVVQESLKNIKKHSQSERAEVFLNRTGNSICLTIKDKGVGFDPLAMREKPGLGLSSMRERVSLVHGDLSIRSRPGQGTVINVCVPLTEGEE